MLTAHCPNAHPMNRSLSDALLAPGPLLLAAMIVAAALSRFLPTPPNFAPVVAIALFAGAFFARRGLAIAVPLVVMALSDLVLGFVRGGTFMEYFTTTMYAPSLLANYACMALIVVMAFGLRGRVSGARVLGYSLAGSLVFFALSNLAVWLTAMSVPGHAACMAGLAPCFAAAVPFFKWTLLSTLFYSALLFGGFALLRARMPALRPQTV